VHTLSGICMFDKAGQIWTCYLWSKRPVRRFEVGLGDFFLHKRCSFFVSYFTCYRSLAPVHSRLRQTANLRKIICCTARIKITNSADSWCHPKRNNKHLLAWFHWCEPSTEGKRDSFHQWDTYHFAHSIYHYPSRRLHIRSFITNSIRWARLIHGSSLEHIRMCGSIKCRGARVFLPRHTSCLRRRNVQVLWGLFRNMFSVVFADLLEVSHLLVKHQLQFVQSHITP
jgi:hypothetical protein